VYDRARAPDDRKIVVVGPCASGKTALVQALQKFGYNARVSAQEHSAVERLWQRSQPDVLIALTANLATIRQRRGPSWPDWLLDVQLRRLQSAFASADLLIDTSRRNVSEMVAEVVAYLVRTRSR
jgi:hypothetical protein